MQHCDKSKALWMRFDSVWFDFRQLGLKFVEFLISTIIIRLNAVTALTINGCNRKACFQRLHSMRKKGNYDADDKGRIMLFELVIYICVIIHNIKLCEALHILHSLSHIRFLSHSHPNTYAFVL